MVDPTLNEREPLKVLLVEDHADDRDLMLLELRRAGFSIESASAWTRADTESQLREQEWQVVLSDHAMPGFSAAGVLELLQQHQPQTPCIIIRSEERRVGKQSWIQIEHEQDQEQTES